MAASHSLSRRELLWLLALSGCGSAVPTPKPFTLPDQTPTTFVDPPPRYSDSVDALFDVLLPAERDARGNVTVPGAREANADAVMRLESVVRLAIAQGFIAPMSENLLAAVDDLAGSARAALNRDLDLLASFEHPLLPFWKLPLEAQNAIVSRAFDDPTRRPVMLVMRAVCFLAYLGGGPSDVGLQALGYPAFENVEAGLAIGVPAHARRALGECRNRRPAGALAAAP